jgi:hypothetical protein
LGGVFSFALRAAALDSSRCFTIVFSSSVSPHHSGISVNLAGFWYVKSELKGFAGIREKRAKIFHTASEGRAPTPAFSKKYYFQYQHAFSKKNTIFNTTKQQTKPTKYR